MPTRTLPGDASVVGAAAARSLLVAGLGETKAFPVSEAWADYSHDLFRAVVLERPAPAPGDDGEREGRG